MIIVRVVRSWILLAGLLLLTACSTSGPRSGDGAPPVRLDPNGISDAVPHYEPVSVAGNRSPYTVNGKTYTILPTASGYHERGIASWYGTKFHGRQTANGERYDMYGMSAAHKTLPLPCYVEVTNLDNGRRAIVRVNDRGPFHEGRIIDLSYAAASKLDVLKHGTARVEVRVLDPGGLREAPNAGPYFVQVGAFSSKQSALNVEQSILRMGLGNVVVRSVGRVYRVQLGPITTHREALSLVEQLATHSYPGAFVVGD